MYNIDLFQSEQVITIFYIKVALELEERWIEKRMPRNGVI